MRFSSVAKPIPTSSRSRGCNESLRSLERLPAQRREAPIWGLPLFWDAWNKRAYGVKWAMGQTSLWAKWKHGANDAWNKSVYRPAGRTGDRMHGCAARSLAIKRGNASLVFRYGIQPRFGGALNFRGFALPWGNSFAHYSWSRSAAFFIWKGIPHGNAREFGTARSGAD